MRKKMYLCKITEECVWQKRFPNVLILKKMK